jgi:hypothetical protein
VETFLEFLVAKGAGATFFAGYIIEEKKIKLYVSKLKL